MSGEQETIQAATEALGRPHELSELRLLGLLEADRTPGEIEVARAITELGSWLCPDAEVSVRLAAARSYLGQRTGRKELRAAGESTWSIAGVVPQATPGEITIEIRELPLVGEGKLLNHGTADEHRGFAFAMAGERPPVVEVQVKVGQEDVRRIGPVRTQPATWVTASEPGIAEPGRVSTPKSRPGRFEVQQRWLHAVANGVAGVNDEVLAAYSGASIHDVRRQRWANELAPHIGDNGALAWVLLTRCCLADELNPEQWLEEAKESLAVRVPAHIAAEIERAFGERFLAEANRADVPKVLEAHRALRREIWCARRHPDYPEGSTWREILDAAGLEPDRLAELPSLFEAGLDDVFDRLQAPGTNLSEAVRARLAWVPLVRYDHTAITRVGEDAPPIAVTRHPSEILAARLTDVAEHQAHIVRALEDRFPGQAVLWHLKPELGEGAQPLFDAGLLDLDKLTVGMWEGAEPHGPIRAARGTTAPIPPVSPEVARSWQSSSACCASARRRRPRSPLDARATTRPIPSRLYPLRHSRSRWRTRASTLPMPPHSMRAPPRGCGRPPPCSWRVSPNVAASLPPHLALAVTVPQPAWPM